MFGPITKDARSIVSAAETEARAMCGARIEAEHLLLGLAADEFSPTARLLAASGLDHAGLRAALERETERSLAAVGVAASAFPLPECPGVPRRKPRFGASSKRALERAVGIAGARGDRRIAAPHLLLGILSADIGTVPRALVAAEVDRVALAARAEGLLD